MRHCRIVQTPRLVRPSYGILWEVDTSPAAGCRFAEAFAAARRCRPPDLQPREFFPLAPQHLDPARQPARRRWGLAQPLNPLEATVSRAASHAGLDPERLLHEGRRQLADYLLWVGGFSKMSAALPRPQAISSMGGSELCCGLAACWMQFAISPLS